MNCAVPKTILEAGTLNCEICEKKEEVNDKLRQDMLNYCGLDTEAMVWIVDELKKLVK